MPLIKQVLSQTEIKDRKLWLLASICSFFIYPMVLFALLAVLSETVSISDELLDQSLVYTISGLFSLLIIMYCAYKSHGTRLLTVWLVTSPIRLFIEIVQALKEDCNALTVVMSICDIAIFVWWYVYSFKLRRINKIIQVHKQGCCEYLESIKELKVAKTLDELDDKFHELIQGWPQFEPVSSKEYKLKRADMFKHSVVSKDQ